MMPMYGGGMQPAGVMRPMNRHAVMMPAIHRARIAPHVIPQPAAAMGRNPTPDDWTRVRRPARIADLDARPPHPELATGVARGMGYGIMPPMNYHGQRFLQALGREEAQGNIDKLALVEDADFGRAAVRQIPEEPNRLGQAAAEDVGEGTNRDFERDRWKE